ncbi:glycine dehydrogenase (aminomethyl-transferring) [Candidatus Endobugula sertula]|uniref:Glycine dehydrogenase (decarboxylating) n=1 Tax=Candidatus Endobugula sertula TaxID=62101 RepID=A0A1D2QPT7_9GAMM|nr:glycine dehydrogenase (aminomethyl-transferring) [Candidatus Endobugula sertula]
MSQFQERHIGPDQHDTQYMLEQLGYDSLDSLTEKVVPASIANNLPLDLSAPVDEEQALAELKTMASQNQVLKTLIGQGYYNTYTPQVIKRNVLENPAWYTAYTPYQPEISQGRLEVLFYFQTMITELTGMDIANASMLDESTAAAEAMTLAYHAARGKKHTFLVSSHCHPQTKALLCTRAEPLHITITEFDETQAVASWEDVFGFVVQYPTTYGDIHELQTLSHQAHENGALAIMATDLLALTLLTSPAQLGADIVVGNSQRFGVPLGFGGPHAGFFATTHKNKRSMPGRLVGQSIDALGQPAYRLALQTREQHIRREKATSNICTAQALLAMMATFYACYHGPQGLKAIARRVHSLTASIAQALSGAGVVVLNNSYFDTLHIAVDQPQDIADKAVAAGYNLSAYQQSVSISLDETSTADDVEDILSWFGVTAEASGDEINTLSKKQLRTDHYLSQSIFHQYHSETEIIRYLRRLADKDIALDRSMIPLGSCTMKLNATSEMVPVTWPEFAQIHPFAPTSQTKGYQEMIRQLEQMLCAATGYDVVSLQPNAGSQGEYAGLLAIKAYHESRGESERDICLIPSSAHGTNPASAQMVNMKVVVTKCDDQGNVDLEDLRSKVEENPGRIAAIMITYPSTHGVFEEHVTDLCALIHDAGGQVYIDGANMNALVGVAAPGKFGGDVSHLNLHKTFCIPHGGGGPGVGPISVGKHLEPFLPKDGINHERKGNMVSGAPFGSAAILPISWMYIRMMGASGMRKATQIAILNANYIAHRLGSKYPILYTGSHGLVAHECIIDTRFMKVDGISVDDIAKRLIDFGFHAPTMSFPVAGTLMVEPTESENLAELERFCRAMLIIHEEYLQVKSGKLPVDDNPLVNAPHTVDLLLRDDLELAYSRKTASHPDTESHNLNKYWPPVARVDNVYGDKNLICSCPSIDSYQES